MSKKSDRNSPPTTTVFPQKKNIFNFFFKTTNAGYLLSIQAVEFGIKIFEKKIGTSENISVYNIHTTKINKKRISFVLDI